MLIYADNAATTRLSRTALDAMLPYLTKSYGNPSSIHSLGTAAAQAVLRAREETAANLRCSPRELTFTSGGSESVNQAIFSAAALGRQQGKYHIISDLIEHHAVLHTLDVLQADGFEITLLPVSENGIVSARDLAAALRPDTALVTIMYANNEIGTIQPVDELGALCRASGVLFHTDAVQAVGHLTIDLSAQPIDLLSFSAHKFHGPKGVGGLYARKGLALTGLIHGGPQERGIRAGTENVPGIVGMAAALTEACARLPADTKKLLLLRDHLMEGLLLIPGAVLNGDIRRRLPGNVNISFSGIEAEELLLLLDQRGIAASAGSACTSGSLQPSHVLTAIGRSPQLAGATLRLTLSGENTKEETDEIIRAVTACVKLLRTQTE